MENITNPFVYKNDPRNDGELEAGIFILGINAPAPLPNSKI